MDMHADEDGARFNLDVARVDRPAESLRFHCLECHQTFGRVEHLTRHSRSHMKERFLKCSFCRKGFYRIDALRRHEQIHKEPRRSVLGKGARACNPCAVARRKCSGGETCSGCERRSIQCTYPNSSKPRRVSSKASGGLERTVQEQVGHTFRSSPMSTSNTSGSRRNSNHGQAFEADDEHGMNDQQQVLDASLSSSVGQSSMIEFESVSIQTQVPRLILDGMQEQSNLPEQLYENNISSINWLPYDWTPDFHLGINAIPSPEEVQSTNSRSTHQTTLMRFENTATTSFLNYPPSPEARRGVVVSGSEPGESQAISSPSSLSTHSAGHFYIDGDGARLPRVRKAPYRIESYIPLQNDENRSINSSFQFLETEECLHINLSSSTEQIPPGTYTEITGSFNQTCITSTHYLPFSAPSFPSLKALSHFVRLYRDNFQSVLPFIHPATFDLSTSHFLLILAIATIGSHYLDIEVSRAYSSPMNEFLRRSIETIAETGGTLPPNKLVLGQIKLLNCVGMMYSGSLGSMNLAKSLHRDLVSFCETEWIDFAFTEGDALQNEAQSVSMRWKIWHEAESRRRTGYCIWFLDCLFSFHFQMRPFLSLDDTKVAIPCQEVLWEAETALDWQQLYNCSTRSPSLHSAIQLAYIEKRIQSSTGEFSRILCIHALFRRTWEVENYFNQPLTLWEPTAERQDMQEIEKFVPVWLPDVPTYSKWRNSACDCLDILHWHANSVIGAASGMEHPTVLHLHLARVILLTPFRDIIQLAQLMIKESTVSDKSELKRLTSHIRRWATEDQYKARLAMIHAGVLFWHVRRYSVDAFYEPSSVFLSTLALWAYGRFSTRTSGINNNQEGETPQDNDEEAVSLFPTSMLLDRPADDELVQLFVKRGATMKANIMGVGNLCSDKGHVRVLGEGRNLLVGLERWGYSRMAIRTLDALAEVCQREAVT